MTLTSLPVDFFEKNRLDIYYFENMYTMCAVTLLNGS